MKPTIMRNRMLYMASAHLISKQMAAPLSDDLQEKYHQHSARVIEGDSVKVLRGEFKGIEGKVTNVSTEKRGIAIEGIKREKLKGGNVDIYIHTSKVMITTLNLQDKWRQSRLEGQKPKTAKQKPAVVEQTDAAKPKEETPKPKEQPKKEEKKEQKPKQKETKAAEKPQKTEKKSPKSKKSDK
ncbi:MAG: 50S ribosomal protein L24 [Thaumarchaeota archaeon]|nr:50S ribosomal protein L24 [Nitrososphaerota archaeon]MDE1866480.1 50S ribosomal protein L24 [Nitrososphaerota archaeon]